MLRLLFAPCATAFVSLVVITMWVFGQAKFSSLGLAGLVQLKRLI